MIYDANPLKHCFENFSRNLTKFVETRISRQFPEKISRDFLERETLAVTKSDFYARNENGYYTLKATYGHLKKIKISVISGH